MNKRKYKVNDIVGINGEEELFEVVEIFVESTQHKTAGFKETCYISVEGLKSSKLIETIGEHDSDVNLLTSRTCLNCRNKDGHICHDDVDRMLDLYNQYNDMHKLMQRLNINDNDYEKKANDIMKTLVNIFGMTSLNGGLFF